MKRSFTKLFFLLILIQTSLPAQLSRAQVISTVAGGNGLGGGGDGEPATGASVKASGVEVDANGNIYLADYYHTSIRKVNGGNGIITTE